MNKKFLVSYNNKTSEIFEAKSEMKLMRYLNRFKLLEFVTDIRRVF